MIARRKEGQYENKYGELVCFDPCVYERGPSCLLVRKDYLLKVMKETGLSLVWIIQGEKQVLNGSSIPNLNFDHRLSGLYYMENNGVVKGNITAKILEYNV